LWRALILLSLNLFDVDLTCWLLLINTQATWISISFEEVLVAMERDDWNTVTEMLNKGELYIKDINKLHDKVRY